MNPATTTARQILALVFEGHEIRTVIEGGKPRFFRNDIATALGIVHVQKSIANHLDPDELGLTKVSVRSATGTVQLREVAVLSESGVLALVCSSRKPAARRFRRWLTDEVMPQLLRYGSYLPGASPAERLAALAARYRAERAACVAAGRAALAEDGLTTLRAYRTAHAIPACETLRIARQLQTLARQRGITPARLTLPGCKNPANAWPHSLIAHACRPFQILPRRLS